MGVAPAKAPTGPAQGPAALTNVGVEKSLEWWRRRSARASSAYNRAASEPTAALTASMALDYRIIDKILEKREGD